MFSNCSEKRSAFIQNDLFFENLKDPVEKVEEIPFNVDSTGKPGDMDSCCISILEYDSKGYRTKQLYKTSNGRETTGQIYRSRFENGHVQELGFMVDGKLVSILKGTLTEDGNYHKSQVFDPSGKLISFYDSIEINEFGKIISMKGYNSDSLLQRTIVNNYEKHIWVGGSVKDGNGKEVFSTTIKLNEKLDAAEKIETTSTSDASTTRKTKYVYTHYDTRGNWIQCNEFDENGNVQRILKRQITYREK
jgi:uncharacterized protein (DUF2147 family)